MDLFKGIKKEMKGKFGTSPSALARRERNYHLLKKMKFPLNEELPLLADNGLNQFQFKQAVARRALCLFSLILVAHGYGPGKDTERLRKWLEENGLWEEMGAKEKAFVENENRDAEEINAFKWRAESLWVLLWAIGLIEELPLPEAPCNLQKMGLPPVLQLTPIDTFLESAKFRKDLELMRQTDLYYLINWTYADALDKATMPPRHFIPGVVYERQFAFTWLSSPGQNWEDIDLKDY